MSIPSDEVISAWLDGAADEAQSRDIEAALASDPVFADHVAALAAADDLVRAAYPIDAQVSDELLMRLGLVDPVPVHAAQQSADVIDFSAARARKQPAPVRRTWPGNLSRVAAQVALVVGLGGLATGWWMMAPGADSPDAQYRALGNANQDTSANGVVMFRATTSAADAKQLLAKSGAQLVAGPSEAGAWRVAVAPAQRDAVLARLRAMPEVTMAAPIDSAG